MSKRQPRTFYEAVEGLMTRTVKETPNQKHLATCDRGLWLGEDRGAFCTARCRLIRAWLDANAAPVEQLRLIS